MLDLNELYLYNEPDSNSQRLVKILEQLPARANTVTPMLICEYVVKSYPHYVVCQARDLNPITSVAVESIKFDLESRQAEYTKILEIVQRQDKPKTNL